MATVDKNFKIKNGLIVGDSTNLVNYTSASPIDNFIGQFWIDDSDTLYAWSGSAWVSVGGGGSASGTPFNIPSTLISRSASGSFQIGAVDFHTASPVPFAIGRMTWDDGEGTAVLGLGGGNVNLKLGQEEVARCYNGTGSTIPKGRVVYISGAQGQRPRISLSNASSESGSSKTFGVTAESILDGEEGIVTTFGIVEGINTASFTDGAALWLSSSAGVMTTSRPTAPLHMVFVGYCIKSHETAGRIFVNPQNGYELEELHNVLITSASNNHIISYNSASGLWVNKSLLNTIKEVDGSGSGIDSDFLDGYDSNYFAPIASATFTGYVNVPEPIEDSNAATKKYVDDTLGGQAVVVSSASAYPVSATQYSLFFNTTSERMAIRVGSVWKEFSFVSDAPIGDGGDSSTLIFANSVDGGDSSTAVFVNGYDGGAS